MIIVYKTKARISVCFKTPVEVIEYSYSPITLSSVGIEVLFTLCLEILECLELRI